MAKLTKKQTKDLHNILEAMVRAKSFVNSKGIALCKVCDIPSTTQHYVPNRESPQEGMPKSLYLINKQAGSEWCLADDAVRRLIAFLNNNSEHIDISVTNLSENPNS